jgi:hypothetical protein
MQVMSFFESILSPQFHKTDQMYEYNFFPIEFYRIDTQILREKHIALT